MRISAAHVKDSLIITYGYTPETWQAATGDASPTA